MLAYWALLPATSPQYSLEPVISELSNNPGLKFLVAAIPRSRGALLQDCGFSTQCGSLTFPAVNSCLFMQMEVLCL